MMTTWHSLSFRNQNSSLSFLDDRVEFVRILLLSRWYAHFCLKDSPRTMVGNDFDPNQVVEISFLLFFFVLSTGIGHEMKKKQSKNMADGKNQ